MILHAIEQIARLIAEWCERERERRDGAGDFHQQFKRMLRTEIRIKVKT